MRISVKGALIGGVLDIVLSAIIGIPFGIYALVTGHLANTPREQLGAALAASIHARPALYIAQLLIGLVCTLIGGYVAAVIAKHDEVLNGLVSSFVCVAVGVFSIARGRQHEGAMMEAALFILTLAAGTCGGLIRSRTRRTASLG